MPQKVLLVTKKGRGLSDKLLHFAPARQGDDAEAAVTLRGRETTTLQVEDGIANSSAMLGGRGDASRVGVVEDNGDLRAIGNL